jgi:hypothetical protein
MPISLSGSLNLSGSLTTTGTITATTLVVQTITSSISSITGSTNFGSLVTDTHTFTGSLLATGSGAFLGSVGIGGATNTLGFLEVWKPGSSIAQLSIGQNATYHTDFFIDTTGNFYIQPQGTTRLTVSSSGNVGIGTTSPDFPLVVKTDASANSIKIIGRSGGDSLLSFYASNGTTAYLDFSAGATYVNYNAVNSQNYNWYCNSALKMTLTSGGLVAIGGATHTFIDYTTNTARFYGGASTNTFGLGAASAIYYQGDASQFYPTADNTRSLGTASYRYTAVYATSGTVNSSDLRQKKNIVKSDLGIDFINKLNPVKYNWIEGDTKTHYGLIAQEIESLNIDNFGALYIEDDKYGLNYSEFIAPMIKAIQELTARVQYLENK